MLPVVCGWDLMILVTYFCVMSSDVVLGSGSGLGDVISFWVGWGILQL